jgi:hypothetical protein
MKKLEEITKRDFKEAIAKCLDKGIKHVAPLGSAGENVLIHGRRTPYVSRVSYVSLRLYNKDVELLLTDTKGDFLFYGRHHLSLGLDYISNSYYQIFKDNIEYIKSVAPNREPGKIIEEVNMMHFQKAYLVIPHWAEEQSVEWVKRNSSPTYAESAGKAKYQKFLDMDFLANDDWFRYRALRWPEMDLFPAKRSHRLDGLTDSAIQKMSHTCAAQSSSPGYRNYYNGKIGDEDFTSLMARGLAYRNKERDMNLSKGTTYYHLTDDGIKAVMTLRKRRRCDIENTISPSTMG